MTMTMLKSQVMPVGEYVTIEEAAAHEGVTFTPYWLRVLCREHKVKCMKLGDERRGQWLIHLPSLMAYIKEMDDLGSKKHSH